MRDALLLFCALIFVVGLMLFFFTESVVRFMKQVRTALVGPGRPWFRRFPRATGVAFMVIAPAFAVVILFFPQALGGAIPS